MKDYKTMARKSGLSIYTNSFDRERVQKYVLNRDNNFVNIKYMDGRYEDKPASDVDIAKLDENQNNTLYDLKKEIFPKVDHELRWKGFLVCLDLLNSILQYSLSNWIAGSCWLTCTGIYFFQTYRPYCLKREMKLVSWINDNKDDVNAVIREEVYKKMDKPVTNKYAINKPTYKYPTDSVPYSEEIYENGISLNNIDELSNRELRKLKRKVLSKRRFNR